MATQPASLSHARQLLALEPDRGRADGMDTGTVRPRAAGGFQNLFRHGGIVVDRIGVRHAENGPETAVRGGGKAGGYGFLPFVARFAQVGVHVNEAREEDVSGGVHDVGVGGGFDGRGQGPHRAVDDEQVRRFAQIAGVLDEKRRHQRSPAVELSLMSGRVASR